MSKVPKIVDILSAIPENYKSKLLPYLKAKPVRTASGIAVVAVMSKPHRCPHIATTGNICVYCPGVNSLLFTLPSNHHIRDQILTLNILLKVTQATNQQA